MGNALVPIVKGFVQDTTDAISGKAGPLLESFTRRTGDLVADNANDINTAEDGVTQNIAGVMKTSDGDVTPGDVVPASAPADPVSAPVGTTPGDLAPPSEPLPGADPVGTTGVGPCGKAGEPVDVVTGQYVTARTDLDLPGVFALVLRRAYASGYRGGRSFGPGWSSTLDIRVQIDPETIRFADDDCRILEYPHPQTPEAATLPVDGERLPLTWDRERDEIRIQNPTSGRTWHFTALSAEQNPTGEVRPLTAISDRNGNRIVIERDEGGLPTEVRHTCGYRIAVDTGYTAAGFRIEGFRLMDAAHSDQGTAILAYQYDPRGRLVAVVDSSSVPFVYEYDAADRISAWIDRLGYRFGYVYDQAGRVVRTDGEGGYLSGSFAYDPDNSVTTYTDSLGQATAYHYDQYGHITKVVNPLGHATTTESDRYGRPLTHADELGNTTRHTLDDSGDLIRIERPDGTQVSTQYNHLHLPLEITDPGGAQWRYAYDERGNVVKQTDPLGAVTTYTYGERGELCTVTDALGNTTTVETNTAGLPLSVTDAIGAVWTFGRDSHGRVVSARDPLGAVTATEYDGEGRPVTQRFADGTAESWTWDVNGNLTSRTDQAGNTITFEIGPFRLVMARIGPDGTRHAFDHDTELRLLSVTNPQKLTWRYSYDQAGNLTGEQDFNNRELSYSYDSAGHVVRRVNGAGQSLDLDRDALGRVTAQRTDDGTVTEFGYDAVGNLIRAQNPACRLTFVRDLVGQVVAEVVGDRTLKSTYDQLGLRLSRTTPSGRVSTWQYDQLGRPAGLTSGTHRISFGRDQAGRETHRWIGADTALTNDWDALGRLTARRLLGVEGPDDARQSKVLQERSWGYRADGAADSETDPIAGLRRFDLDQSGRITAVSAATWTEQYAYDSAGNLSYAIDSRKPEGPTSGERQLTGTLLRKAGRTQYEYDDQGRLTKTVRRTLSGQYRTWTYQYDAHDRLTAATTPDGEQWRYRYDPLGRRLSKQRLRGNGDPVEEIRFTWDNTVLVEQDHFRASVPTVTITGWDHEPDTWTPVLQVRRTYDATTPQQLVDHQFHAIVADLVGTPTELVTTDGKIAWRRQSGLWGNRLSGVPEAGATTCPLGFPGQYHDDETGLDYNYFRYYDSGSGRYATPDPLGLAPADNHHAYVGNPLGWIDPLGLAAKPKVIPNFIVDSNGVATPATTPGFVDYNHVLFPVPEGAYGPFPVNSGKGFQYIGGSGGTGMDPKVTGVRFMEPTTGGTYPHPSGYANYMNKSGQTVNRETGQTIAKKDPAGHLDAC